MVLLGALSIAKPLCLIVLLVEGSSSSFLSQAVLALSWGLLACSVTQTEAGRLVGISPA